MILTSFTLATILVVIHRIHVELIKEKIINKKTIIFVNTRSQVEILYKELTLSLDPNLTIGIHHGSLFKEHRLKVESHFISAN